jgi:hypothetical protein
LHGFIALAEAYHESKNVTEGWRKTEEILQTYCLSNVGRVVKQRRMRWAGKIAHLEGMMNVYNI